MDQEIPEFIRRRRVEAISGLSKSEIYRRVAAGTFPAPVSVNQDNDTKGRGTRWVLSEVVAWAKARIALRTARAPVQSQAATSAPH